jgi:hypothetical protein
LVKNDEAGFQRIGREVREELAGKLFSREILDQVLQALDEYRASPKTTAGP